MRWKKDRDESKKRDILIKGAIMRLAGTLALETYPGIHKDDPPAKTLSSRGEDTQTGLAL